MILYSMLVKTPRPPLPETWCPRMPNAWDSASGLINKHYRVYGIPVHLTGSVNPVPSRTLFRIAHAYPLDHTQVNPNYLDSPSFLVWQQTEHLSQSYLECQGGRGAPGGLGSLGSCILHGNTCCSLGAVLRFVETLKRDREKLQTMVLGSQEDL